MTHALEQVLTRFELLKQAVALEPRLMAVFQAAAACEWQPGYNRWNDYERLKCEASHLVGWGSTNPLLQASSYYEVCIVAIDWLLPNEPETIDVTYPQIEGVPV